MTDAGIVTDHPSVGGQSPVPMRTKKSYLHAENNELELEAVPTSRRNLKFGGPGGGGGAPGGPRASWPGPKNGGVETLSQVKTRIHGSNRPIDVDETRLSKDERQFLDAMGSHRVMVSDRARLAASVAELGLLPTGDAPITTQPGAGYKTRPGGVARPNTGSAAGGPKQVSAVDYANSGAPIAPVRASWNPDASPSREEAAFDPAKSLRQSLTRPRTSPAAAGALHRDENDDPTDYPYDAAAAAGTHDPNPWADRNASLRAAVRNRLRPSSARSQVSSLGDLEQLEQTVEALRKSYRRADPPARGRGASARLVTMSVDGLGGLDAERVVKIAEREARDWEWQSSWQWEWQQELDVETRGRRRPATAAPTTTRRQQQQPQQQVPAKVHPSPVKSPVKSPVTACGDVHADEDEFEFHARAETVVGGEHAGHEEPRAVGPETAEVSRVRQVPSRRDEEPVQGAHRRREARVTRAGVARPPRAGAGANTEGCRSFFGCRRGPGAECQVWPPSASVGHARVARRRDALADAPIAADAEGNVAVAVAGEGHVRGAEGGVPRVQGRRRG